MLPCNCSMMMETNIEKNKKIGCVRSGEKEKHWNEKIIVDAINFCNTKSTRKLTQKNEEEEEEEEENYELFPFSRVYFMFCYSAMLKSCIFCTSQMENVSLLLFNIASRIVL